MSEVLQFYLSVAANTIVFVVTIGIVVGYFTNKNEEGHAVGTRSLRYYTTLSNVFSALVCGAFLFVELKNCTLCGVPFPHWLIVLKYISTATVTCTMLTVLFFLGPTQGYGVMLGGTSLFTHLIGPLLAILSFMLLEDFDSISIKEAALGLIPTIIYSAVYLSQVIIFQEKDREGKVIKGWEDFYGFNRGGRWYVSLVVMNVLFFGLLLVLRLIYNR